MRIGLLFGMEDTFPWALIDEITRIGASGGPVVTAEPVATGALRDDVPCPYAIVVDRISHEVPFYRTYLKAAAATGTHVVNNPFWWSADDKFFGNLVAKNCHVAVPRTVLLPHKEHPPNTESTSFRNLEYVDWDGVFAYLGFPIFLKPAYGGGWKDVYRCTGAAEVFAAYDRTRDLTMMAQEAIVFDDYFRCYTIGRERFHAMRYDPLRPHAERYVLDAPPVVPDLHERMRRDALALSGALGYDMNTVEFAISGGVPVAIDFTNPAPDADRPSVGSENFAWIVRELAELLVERARRPRPFEMTGTWPIHAGLSG